MSIPIFESRSLPSYTEVREMAAKLHAQGIYYCESRLVESWMPSGWDPRFDLLRLIDTELLALRLYDRLGIQTISSSFPPVV